MKIGHTSELAEMIRKGLEPQLSPMLWIVFDSNGDTPSFRLRRRDFLRGGKRKVEFTACHSLRVYGVKVVDGETVITDWPFSDISLLEGDSVEYTLDFDWPWS